MSQEIPFEPFLFQSPHHQTILSSFLNFIFEPISKTVLVPLPDGDRLAMEITEPEGWKPTDLSVVLVHGLCGSHQSPNPARMAKRLSAQGIRAIRFNMRGCGSGRGLAKHIYHSGRSEDLFEALKLVKFEHPDSPIVLIGFSLGGNIVLKLVGELNALGHRYLKGVIAVSPPVDLYSSVQMIGQPENAFYERYFYKLLRADVYYRHKKFKDLPPCDLPKNLKLYEFDQIYTAPNCGFNNAIDYYNKCSAAHVVEDIAIPCKILLSEDDPIISAKSLDMYNFAKNIEVFKTKKGGHMGYLSSPRSEKGFYWLDSLLEDWVKEFALLN
jgi:predicted alpha/beta-fold hydrolase